MQITLNIEGDEREGFTAEIIGETDSVYGDTFAEAAMTALYLAYAGDNDNQHNGWRHNEAFPGETNAQADARQLKS